MIKNCLIYLKGEDRTNDIEKCYLKDNKLCVIFKRNNDVYEYNEASYKIVEKACANNVFNYFSEISKKITIKNEETNTEDSILGKEYDKISNKSLNKKSALYLFLHPDKFKEKQNSSQTIIYPFSSNISQSMAIDNAINSQISIIEGPPGTGKTQTILNIIANIISIGKNVAVVSNNNSAIDNVYEKLSKNNFGYICAFLGNKVNKAKFIEEQNETYPKTEEYPQIPKLLKEIDTLNKQAYLISDYKNKQAKLKQELYSINLEYQYFKNQVNLDNIQEDYDLLFNKSKQLSHITSQSVLEIKNHIEYYNKVKLFYKLKLVLINNFGSFDFYKKNINHITTILEKLFYDLRVYEINNELKHIEKTLNSLDENVIMNKQREYSLYYFRDMLDKKYNKKEKRHKFEKNDFISNASDIIKEYPVILSTTYAIKYTLEMGDELFDYIIIDEASQVDLVTGVLALSVAKHAVIVGDTKQLTHIIENNKLCDLIRINHKYKITNNYNFIQHNLLSACLNTFKNIPCVLLKEHYRCHPQIIGFCNQKYYNNELIILSKDNNEENVLKAIKTVKGNHEIYKYNQREIDEICKTFIPELIEKIKEDEIGVISPYVKQKSMIESTLNGKNIQVDTVHKYQGREKDAIILTTVMNDINDFIDNSSLINVAVSRAKTYFRVVASHEIVNGKNNISDLYNYIQYNGGQVTESKLQSIFDLLYSANKEARMSFLKGKRLISKYDSENLMFEYLNNILSKFDDLRLMLFVKLNRIIKDNTLLNEEECNFLNSSSHVDFLLINTLNKQPVCAIEVDGFSFHNKKKQIIRDNIKNTILEKYNIPLIRLSTKGSGEEQIIIEKLVSLGYKLKEEI